MFLSKHYKQSSLKMESLNLSGKEFCKKVGISFNSQIMQQLRQYGLVDFFKVGKKYFYPAEDADKISDKLRKEEILIKTNKGYYITIND